MANSSAPTNLQVIVGGAIDSSLDATLKAAYNKMKALDSQAKAFDKGQAKSAKSVSDSQRKYNASLKPNLDALERKYAVPSKDDVKRIQSREKDMLAWKKKYHAELEGENKRATASATTTARQSAVNERLMRRAAIRDLPLPMMAKSFLRFSGRDGVSLKQEAGLGLVAAGAGVGYAAKQGATLDDKLREAIITNGAAMSSFDSVASKISNLAGKGTGQTMDNLAEALNAYVEAGVSIEDALARLNVSGKVATATHTSVTGVADTERVFKTMFRMQGKTPQEDADMMRRAWNIAAISGDSGNFKIKNIVEGMSSLAPSAQRLGLSGERDMSYLLASLQAQTKQTGDPSRALEGMNGLLTQLGENGDLTKNLEKSGVSVEMLRRQGATNAATGEGGSVLELLADRLAPRFASMSEPRKSDFLLSLSSDAHTREALSALMTNRDSIAAQSQKQLAGAGDDSSLSKKFEDANASSKQLWASMGVSRGRFSQAATVAFLPTLKGIAWLLDGTSKFVLSLTAAHKGVAGLLYPILMAGGAVLGLGLKMKFLGKLFNVSWMSKAGGGILRFSGFLVKELGMAALKGGRYVGEILGSVVLRALSVTSRTILPLIMRGVTPVIELAGSLILRVLGVLAQGVSGFMLRFAPMIGNLLLRGLGFVLSRGVLALLGSIGLLVTAAILGWKLGKLIGDQIAEPLAGFYAKLSGLQAQIEAMAHPFTTKEMDATRLSSLTGESGQAARGSALKAWEAKMADENARLKAKQSEFYTSDADQIEIDQLKSSLRLGAHSVATIKAQMARQAGGGGAIGDSPEAIAAAQARLDRYSGIVAGGKDEGDITLADAKAYTDGLRAQLAAAKAKGTTLGGAAGGTTHTTNLNVDVTGATAEGAATAVTDAVASHLRERDREVERGYRGVVATGSLGD